MKDGYWILEGKKVKEASDMLEWGQWFQDHRKDRTIANTKVGKDNVSTVFIGTDHNFEDGELHIFETMIFPSEEVYKRYPTWEKAEAGHKKAVQELKNAKKKP